MVIILIVCNALLRNFIQISMRSPINVLILLHLLL
jgi:hypothetical protein